ncbi:MAG: type 3 dihydrofolate reductase [Methylobacter sp.]|nr:type 3 dihydrofolate reductase [Methylobacter sp.]MDP2098681.1 type 3 dihydrofolate reductase [Methylobacter sp.]MDP2428951.1 type 3 dihydrofolate reductase [Methylobacter sp.]MDP3056145.1 type 3 dihydrofolate reductase [Methylobacter sp.]MDP3363482.1 type 3 dihydrofolate reductase [Methylobacter sp.]
MKISLIVAMASNRVIGLDNKMPWHLSADLKKFKQITLGAPILMGRKTYESIGRPLPGRTNIIISRNPEYHQPGCLVFNDIKQALARCSDANEVFIIGGSDFYRSMLPVADTLYLTQIHQDFDGDTFFPELDAAQWLEVAREDVNDDPDAAFSYSFLTLEKRIRAIS